MTDYLPGAKVIPGSDSGPMLGGPRKVVWHTTENDPTTTTAANVAKYLLGSGNTVHILWHPLTGEMVQMIPANRGGKGLENRPGGVETNRAGTYVIQIEVVGRASQPFTDGPCVGLPKIQAWLASLGIPAVWSGTQDRSVASWAKGGHFGHMDVPENSHTDPGRVNKTKLAGPVQPVPPPKEIDVPITPAEMQKIAELTVHQLLVTNLGSSGPNVAVALQNASGLNSAAIAAAVLAAVPAGTASFTVEALAKAVADETAKRLAS